MSLHRRGPAPVIGAEFEPHITPDTPPRGSNDAVHREQEASLKTLAEGAPIEYVFLRRLGEDKGKRRDHWFLEFLSDPDRWVTDHRAYQWIFRGRPLTPLGAGAVGSVFKNGTSAVKIPKVTETGGVRTEAWGDTRTFHISATETMNLIAEFAVHRETQRQWDEFRRQRENTPSRLVVRVENLYRIPHNKVYLDGGKNETRSTSMAMTMELAGGSLGDLIKAEDDPSDTIFSAILQVCNLIRLCETADIRFNHRDAHTQNILFFDNGGRREFALADMGFSCVVSGKRSMQRSWMYQYYRGATRRCDNPQGDLRRLLTHIYTEMRVHRKKETRGYQWVRQFLAPLLQKRPCVAVDCNRDLYDCMVSNYDPHFNWNTVQASISAYRSGSGQKRQR